VAYKHGKNGRVIAAGATLNCTEWDGEDATEPVHTENTESGGYQEMLLGGGVSSLNGNVTAILADGTPPPLQSGQIVAMELYEGGKTAAYKYALNAFISNVKRHNVVKSTDPIMFSFSYMSSGPITTRPTS
jgi:hypothetical protein